MAAKKKSTRKTARKNPRRHIPKTTRGRKPGKAVFVAKAYDKKGAFLFNREWKNISLAAAEMRSARLVRNNVARVILEY